MISGRSNKYFSLSFTGHMTSYLSYCNYGSVGNVYFFFCAILDIKTPPKVCNVSFFFSLYYFVYLSIHFDWYNYMKGHGRALIFLKFGYKDIYQVSSFFLRCSQVHTMGVLCFPVNGVWGGGLAFEGGRYACQKFWIKPLKETYLGVVQAFFEP